MTLSDFVRWLKEQLNVNELVFSLIIGIVFVNLSLIIHELSHVIVANLLGVKASIAYLQMFTGATSLGEATPSQMILIALAGPLGALLYGLYMWYLEPDGILRFAGLASFFYSVIPNLAPFIQGSDMYVAIQNGLNPFVGWIIYLFVFAYCTKIVLDEIYDRLKRY